jgi:hypothetical protein
MKFLKKAVSSFVLVLFLGYGPLFTGVAVAATPAAKPVAGKPAAAKKDSGKTVSGKELLAEAKKAVAGILKESKASGGKLDPKSKKQAPFFSGLKELQSSLEESETKLKAKDKKLFDSLSKGSTALAKVKTAWPRLGVANAKVDGYLGKLDNSYSSLRSRYGSEGLRAKQGAALSAKEKANFEKVKTSQADFAKKLAPMQAKAKQKGDKGTDAQLSRLIAQSNKISSAQLTVDAFLTAMLLVDYLQGEWDCYSYYVGPEYRAAWVEIDVWVESSFTTYDTLYWETVDTYAVESWDYWDVEMELDIDVEFEITDISDADLLATDEYFDASFTYDELSWEDYSTEFASAEIEDTVYEEEEVNLDVAQEAWEDEGLEVDAADDMLDENDAEEAAEDDDDAEGDDAGDAEGDDAEGDDAEGDDAEGDDAEVDDAEGDDAEADDAAGDDAEGDDDSEGDDAEADDGGEDEGGDEDTGEEDAGGDDGEEGLSRLG